MKCIKRFFFLSVVLSALASCTQYLRTAPAVQSEVSGTYSLVLYGGTYLTDLKTLAVLDREGGQYEIVPYAPEFDYRIIKGLQGPDALRRAEQFVTGNPSAYGFALGRIFGPGGEVIGYEVRPLYYPFELGMPDILYTTYWVKGNTVLFIVRFRPPLDIQSDNDSNQMLRHER